MPREVRLYEPDQGLLLPPSLRDWLPEGHLAFFISDAIDAMDLSAFGYNAPIAVDETQRIIVQRPPRDSHPPGVPGARFPRVLDLNPVANPDPAFDPANPPRSCLCRADS